MRAILVLALLHLSMLSGAANASQIGISETAQKVVNPAEEQVHPFNATDILYESYLAATTLAPGERAFQMAYLAKGAVEVGDPRSSEWAREGLGLARQLPLTWNRLALQKNLLIALSARAPATAMEELCLLDPPVPMDGRSIPEDVRADSARTIFSAYWARAKASGLDEIRRVSSCIGDNGEFPFAAVTPVILDLAKRGSEDGLMLFQTAVSYFNRRPEIPEGDQEIVKMLLSVQSVFPDWALARPLKMAVGRLTNTDTALDPKKTSVTFMARTYSKTGTKQYDSQRELLLNQLLPEIQRVDPLLAEQVMEEHPAVRSGRQTSEAVDRTESITILGAADPGSMRQLQLQGLETERLRDIQSIVQSDPATALNLAKTLSMPAIRSQALSAIASAIYGSDPELAARLAKDARRDLDSAVAVSEQINAAAAAILSAAKVGDRAAAEQILQSALESGIKVWQQKLDLKPFQAAFLCDVFEPLVALVHAGARIDPVWTVTKVRQLEALKRSYLLIPAAEGVHEANAAQH